MSRIQAFREAFDAIGRQAVLLGGLLGLALVFTAGMTIDTFVVLFRHASLQQTVERSAVVSAFELSRNETAATAYEVVGRLVRQENTNAHFDIATCDTLPPDQWNAPENIELQCVAFSQDFVRVSATLEQPTFFLNLFGIDALTIYASAIAEIATAQLNE